MALLTSLQLSTNKGRSRFNRCYCIMGNNSNSIQGPQARFVQLGIDQNEMLSTLMLVKESSTQQKMFLKQTNIASDVEYSKMAKQFRQRKLLSDKKIGKYLVRVRDLEGKETSEICGKNYKLLLYIEYLPNSLKTIFSERLKSKRYFEQDQLLSLLRAIVNGLIVLHDNNFKNVYLHKQAIVITSQNAYKIMDTQLCNRIHPFFQILNGVPPKNGTYLAPELLNDIKRGSVDFYHSPKADLFTVGVLLIQLATLSNCDRFYNYQNKTVDVVSLRELAAQLQFSQEFRELLLCLLQEEEEQRIGMLSLREMLAGTLASGFQSSLLSQDLIREESQVGNAVKQTARTGISKSKRLASVQLGSVRTAKQANERVVQPPRPYRQISEYVNNIPSRQNTSQISKRSFQSVQTAQLKTQPMPLPVEVQVGQYQRQVPRISINNTLPIVPVKCTPKAQPLNDRGFQLRITKQFDTPVNLLIQNQHSPEVTPLQKIQEVAVYQREGTLHQRQGPAFQREETMLQREAASLQRQVNAVQRELILQQRETGPKMHAKPGVQVIKTDIFKDKSYGRLDFSNGAKYQGEFNSQGEFDGNGMLYYPDSKICYSGSWKSNAFHGFGVLHNQNPEDTGEATQYWSFHLGTSNWSYYQGEFSMDRKEGFGTMYMTNGDKFSGCFKNDAIEGFGTFFIAKEEKYINGIWANNVLKH